MKKLIDVGIHPDAQAKLTEYQAEIDAIGSFADKVAAAKDKFSHRNKKSNPAFKEIRTRLDEMCSGARRCAYCEDSCADEVEHIRPKDLYPENVFHWPNYLYACGPCNGYKNNHWAVFRGTSAVPTQVERHRGDPVTPPPEGQPAFIDPRQMNPLDLIELDLIDTFAFLPITTLSPRERARAQYTIDTLGLNDRDVLLEARREAYQSYKARLYMYSHRKADHAPQAELDRIREGILNMQHPTVWEEIKRQRDKIQEIADLFLQAPEAASW